MCLTKLIEVHPDELVQPDVVIYKGFKLTERGLGGCVYPYHFQVGVNYPEKSEDPYDPEEVGGGVFHAYLNEYAVFHGDFAVRFRIPSNHITHIGTTGDVGVRELTITPEVHNHAISVYKERQDIAGVNVSFANNCGATILAVDWGWMEQEIKDAFKEKAQILTVQKLRAMKVAGVRIAVPRYRFDIPLERHIERTILAILHEQERRKSEH